MSSGHFKPEHTPQLTPCLTVVEPEQTMSFYELVFGFERIGSPLIREGLIIFSEMYCLEARIMLQRQGSLNGASQTPNQTGSQQGIGIYLYVPDLDIHHQKASSCGADILSEPMDTFWGDRIYTARDIDGYVWTFAEKIQNEDNIGIDPEELSEHEPIDSLSKVRDLNS